MKIQQKPPRLFEDLSPEVQTLCLSLRDGLYAILKDNLYGIYLFGASVFAETKYIKDIDFFVVIKDPPSKSDNKAIKQLHDELNEESIELDGHYVLLNDATKTSAHIKLVGKNTIDEWWPLHRAHMLAGYCIVLYGPDQRQLFRMPVQSEIMAVLEHERRYIEKHLVDYPSYCVLNLCRLAYSHIIRDIVVSKQSAADWFVNRFPTWAPLITAALREYAREDKEKDNILLKSQTEEFYRFACDRINETIGK